MRRKDEADAMTKQEHNPLFAYIGAFVAELPRAGVQHAVICPGSRSTPLAMALATQPDIRVWMHVDERSAAFFALGMAKQLRAPVALVCTSGSAAANFFPAIVEAKLSHVPLLVLTADRPPELRDNGAPQTIDQLHLYGTHAKWFHEVALPEATPAALRYIRTVASRAIATARAIPAGPVHLNMPFREPLVPGHGPSPTPSPFYEWRGEPAIIVTEPATTALDPAYLMDLTDRLYGTPRGLLIVGPIDRPDLIEPVLALGRQLRYPILADPLAGLRGGEDDSLLCASYDAFLRDTDFVVAHPPEIIVRLGAMPISKPLLQYLQHYGDCPQIVVDSNGEWPDPTNLATEMIHVDPVQFCLDVMADRLTNQPSTPNPWLDAWHNAEQTTRATLQAGIDTFAPSFEGRVFTELAQLLPPTTTLFVGNSMPVRDLDTFFWHAPGVRVMANRGANGIDGIISTALGVSAMQPEARTVLVIGDLSFYHDLNGLLAAKLHQLHLTIVLINNDGGGIFSFLPQADFPDHFEQLFGTPTGLDFALAVQMYGGTFQHAQFWKHFREIIAQSLEIGGLQVVQVTTDRASNVTMHRELWQQVGAALHDEH